MAAQVAQLSATELLGLFSSVMRELRRRKIVRSSNNPTADYAEYLACRALNLTPAKKSTRGYDAVDSSGVCYEIKGRRPTLENKSRQLSAIRRLDEGHFQYLVGIVFSEDFSVLRGCLVPWERVKQEARYREHINGWVLHLPDSLWLKSDVEDITGDLRAAERSLS